MLQRCYNVTEIKKDPSNFCLDLLFILYTVLDIKYYEKTNNLPNQEKEILSA